MKVTVNITKFDYIKFNIAILPKIKGTYISILITAIFVFMFLIWWKGIPQTLNSTIAIFLGSIGGGIIGTLAGIIFSFLYVLIMPMKNNGIFGEHEYTITQEGLYEKTVANEGLSKWEGIVRVVMVKSYLLFQISDYLFHIVPKSSFDTSEEFYKFSNHAKSLWKDSNKK